MDELKHKLQEELKDKNGGVSAAVYHNGSTEFYNYGTGNPDENSLYEIGSITKVFTALLFLILEDKGQADRHDPIKKHLPGIDFQDSKVADIKLEQLVLHSSGLPRLPDNMPINNPEDPYVDYAQSHLYNFLSSHTLDRDSIGEYEYSNLGYGLLGHILELASNSAYADLVEEEILQPLNMHSSFVNSSKENDTKLEQGHDTGREKASNWHLGILVGAGGIISSAHDMGLFLEAQIHPPDSKLGQRIRVSQTPFVSNDDTKKHGFGWPIYIIESRDNPIGLSGETGGYKSFIGFTPNEKFGLVMLANCKPNLDRIAAEMFELA